MIAILWLDKVGVEVWKLFVYCAILWWSFAEKLGSIQFGIEGCKIRVELIIKGETLKPLHTN